MCETQLGKLILFMRKRMRGGFCRLRGKEIFLISIFLLSATIILWGWERTPYMTAFVSPQTQLQLSSEQSRHVVSEASFASKEENSVHMEVDAQRNSVEQFTKSNGNSETSTYREDEQEKGEILEPFKSTAVEIPRDIKQVEGIIQQTVGENVSEQNLKEDLRGSQYLANDSSLVDGNNYRNLKNPMPNKVCNYAKGKWVPDKTVPLYSGFNCKQWLSGMWACRLTQRTDFSYEKLRWQPKDCQLEEFTGSKFLRRMQNKTLAFVGDSLGRQQFQSLMCMVTGGNDTLDAEDIGKEYGFALAPGDTRPSGWAYRFRSYNTTILYYWSAILCDVEPINASNPSTDYAMHLDRPPAFLRQNIHRFDVLVLNTGHHWNRGKLNANRWVMHVGGVPNTDRKIAMIGNAKNLTIYSIASWVNLQLPKYPSLKAFFRTISPRHFIGGDWNTGGSCDNTTPMSVGKEILDDESTDKVVGGAVKGTGVKLLDITALSQLRDEAHLSRYSITAKPGVQDCLHWCLPGVPDTWNEILFSQI